MEKLAKALYMQALLEGKAPLHNASPRWQWLASGWGIAISGRFPYVLDGDYVVIQHKYGEDDIVQVRYSLDSVYLVHDGQPEDPIFGYPRVEEEDIQELLLNLVEVE